MSARIAGSAGTLIVAIALVLSGCGGGKKAASTLPANVVFRVAGTDVTIAKLDRQLALAKGALGTSYPTVGTANYDSLRAQALSRLLRSAEIREGARSLGIKLTPAMIAAEVKQVEQTAFPGKTAGTVDRVKLAAELKKTGSSEATLRDQVEQKLLSEAIQKRVAPSASVTDKEVAAEYTKTKATYRKPERRDVRHILVKQKALADQLYGKLTSSDAQFAALAKQYSTDKGSAIKGGSLGVSNKGAFVPAFDKVAFTEPTGVVSKPVKTQFGWHLIEAVGDILPASTQPLDATLKAQIKAQLETTKKQAKLQTWFTKIQAGLDSRIEYAPGFGTSASG